MKVIVYFKIIVLCLFLSACGHFGKVQSSTSVDRNESDVYFELKLHAQDNEVQRSTYVSDVEQKSYFSGELFDTKTTRNEFLVEMRHISELSHRLNSQYTNVKGQLAYEVITLEARGDGENRPEDFGFPPVKVPTLFVFDSEYKVLKAGDYGLTSVFYVAPVPLPVQPVKIGDSWDFQAKWTSEESEIPFEISLAVIFKSIRGCPVVGGRCAVLEVSGDTRISSPYNFLANFASEVSGQMLFSIDRGILVESRIVSEDRTLSDQSRLESKSVLSGVLTEISK